MPSVNKVIIIGNLTRDPQTKQLPNQSVVTEFGLAMNRKFKGSDGAEREEVCFVDCAAFGRQAEIIQKYCQKGKLLYVEGRLRYDSWDDKNGHGKRSKLSIIVESFQFLGGREDGGGDAPPARQAPASIGAGVRQNLANKPKPQPPFGDEQHFTEEDCPF